MADKEKSSEKADGKADNKKKHKETALVTSAGTPNASASVPEMVCPGSLDSDILLSSQTQWKIDTCATAHMCNDLDKYHEFIPNYEAIVKPL